LDPLVLQELPERVQLAQVVLRVQQGQLVLLAFREARVQQVLLVLQAHLVHKVQLV
jgi:hypothetical protein